MSFAYIRFHAALKAQNSIARSYRRSHDGSPTQATGPSSGLSSSFGKSSAPRTPESSPTHLALLRRVQGYAVFLKGNWSVATFIFNYGIIGLALVIGMGWKVVERTPFRRSSEVDLTSGLEMYAALTDHYRREREAAPGSVKDRVLAKMF